MKVISCIFALIFILAMLGTLFTLGRTDKIGFSYKIVICDVVLVLLGFGLGIAWDIIKDYRKEKAERESIVLMLQSELGSMFAAINTDLSVIDKNLLALNNKQEVLQPLLLLETNAWESAKLRNNIFIKNTGDLFKLINLYTTVYIINEKIKFRENYRVSNGVMPNYIEKLIIIDNDIKQALTKMKSLHEAAQQFLHSEFPLIVKGYGFSLVDGKVENK